MRTPVKPLSPSSSLPPLRSLPTLTKPQLLYALRGLAAVYCPLSLSQAFTFNAQAAAARRKKAAPLLHQQHSVAATNTITAASTPTTAAVDSGYASATEDDDARLEAQAAEAMAALRADGFERACAERWVTGFVGRVEELACFEGDDAGRQEALDEACFVLEALCTAGDGCRGVVGENGGDGDEDEEHEGYTRDFSFELAAHDGQASSSDTTTTTTTIHVQLKDHLAGQSSSSDYDDVGLQSWGASMVISQLLCDDPAGFGLDRATLGPSPRIIDLGAGTGLVTMVLRKLLQHIPGISSPTVVATDYHPAVLENLRSNINMNFFPCPASNSNSAPTPPTVHTSPLDWSNPALDPPFLDGPADMLIATDVVYAAEHAVWLRDCATRLLAPGGTFVLMATVRQTGRFEGISATVGAAFAAEDRPTGGADGTQRLTVFREDWVEKRRGIGRGDESGYRLFRIGWA